MSKSFKFINVGSGSKGNASFIMYKDTLIQIDMGLTLTKVKKSLQKFNKTVNDIDALLLTHSHNDHIKGVHLYKGKIPIYATKETYDKEPHKTIKAFDELVIKDISINVLQTSHDAPNSVGYLFMLGDERFCYITDTGILPAKTSKIIANCDYFVFESNHDVDMLKDSGRPERLIKRILSSKGHLSNLQSADYMVELIGDKTKGIYLAHLSEECNTEEVAIEAHKQAYEENGICFKNIDIKCLRQNEETEI